MLLQPDGQVLRGTRRKCRDGRQRFRVLLGNVVLRQDVARVWRHREATEREAARLFAALARDMQEVGVDAALVALAHRAAQDEERHAMRCQEIVARFGSEPSVPQPPGLPLGPPNLGAAPRVLFACVALCCVTETLSTALLLEMRESTTDPLVRRTVHEILRDEVDHARIGWAHLALEARRGNSAWLSPHLPGMLRAAMRFDGELLPAKAASGAAAFGILAAHDVRRILRDVAADVLFPGFERFDVDTRPARAQLEDLVA